MSHMRKVKNLNHLSLFIHSVVDTERIVLEPAYTRPPCDERAHVRERREQMDVIQQVVSEALTRFGMMLP